MEGNLTTLEENVSDLKQEKESLEKVNCCSCFLMDCIEVLRHFCWLHCRSIYMFMCYLVLYRLVWL